jgi:type III pantothenate kinase
MLLAIDIGNTDTVFGIWQKNQWTHTFRMRSLEEQPAAYYENQLKLQFLEAGLGFKTTHITVLSSVVPSLTPVIQSVIENLTGKSPIVVKYNTFPAVTVAIDHAHEIGSDLVANAVAAYVKYRRNIVIVDFGTALTFTTVSAAGEILGVAIAPGLKTAVKALFSNTAQLPEVPLKLPDSAIGKNTAHAIQAGILLGYESLVRGMITRIRKELDGDCIAIATGGLSSIIGTLEGEFVEINRQLTLEGLRVMGEYHLGVMTD